MMPGPWTQFLLQHIQLILLVFNCRRVNLSGSLIGGEQIFSKSRHLILQYAVALVALCIWAFQFLNENLIEGGMRDTQDCIDFCAKKGIQPDTELVGIKLDDRDVVNGDSRWSQLMWGLIFKLFPKVTADQIEAVYDKLREKNDRITRYVLDITNSDWNVRIQILPQNKNKNWIKDWISSYALNVTNSAWEKNKSSLAKMLKVFLLKITEQTSPTYVDLVGDIGDDYDNRLPTLY